MAKKNDSGIISPEWQSWLVVFKDTKDIRNKFREFTRFDAHPATQYEKWAKLLDRMMLWENVMKGEKDLVSEIAFNTNITETHRMLAQIPQTSGDITAILELAQDIIDEYDCKTAMERSLCEIIAASYFSVMKASRRMQDIYSMEHLSSETIWYYALISKEMEKQSRVYMSALMTLRAIKSPFGNVSIKAKNAFIGENQQFNNNAWELWEKN